MLNFRINISHKKRHIKENIGYKNANDILNSIYRLKNKRKRKKKEKKKEEDGDWDFREI